jgi:hypothetical protein
VYIDTGSSVPNIPSTSRGLADENNKLLTLWKGFETSVIVLLESSLIACTAKKASYAPGRILLILDMLIIFSEYRCVKR